MIIGYIGIDHALRQRFKGVDFRNPKPTRMERTGPTSTVLRHDVHGVKTLLFWLAGGFCRGSST